MISNTLKSYNPQLIRDSILNLMGESDKLDYNELKINVLLDLEVPNTSQNIKELELVFSSLIDSGKIVQKESQVWKTNSAYEYNYSPQELEPNAETSLLIKGDDTIYSIGSHYYLDNWVGLHDGYFINVDLIREPNNPYDRNAVAICYQNKIMGHLTRDAAKTYNEPLQLLEQYNFFMTVSAYIDSDFRKGTQYRFLKLFMPKPEVILEYIK